MVRHRSAGKDAWRRRRKAEPGNQLGLHRRHDDGAFFSHQWRADRRLTRRIRQTDVGRNREVVEGGEVRRDQGGIGSREARALNSGSTLTGLECASPQDVGYADAEKGNHGPRRMGCHRGAGNGFRRAGAASAKTPAAGAYGRHQEASRQWPRACSRHAAPRPGQVPAVSRARPTDDLPRVWHRGRIRLSPARGQYGARPARRRCWFGCVIAMLKSIECGSTACSASIPISSDFEVVRSEGARICCDFNDLLRWVKKLGAFPA